MRRTNVHWCSRCAANATDKSQHKSIVIGQSAARSTHKSQKSAVNGQSAGSATPTLLLHRHAVARHAGRRVGSIHAGLWGTVDHGTGSSC